MRINSIQLNGFTLFKDNGTKSITVDFSERVQIIIGTNGSGKTVFTKQLSAMPPARPLFDKPDSKGGSKTLILSKGNHAYRLVSDFTKPSSPHGFYIDDSADNLNTGGTTEIQKELIVEHLGITPFVDDLIMNRYDFPKMGAAERRKFLMGINPDEIFFVLDLGKKISAKVKACKNNLSRLQTRKMELEQDFLTPEALADLEAERLMLEQDLTAFQQHLTNLDFGMRTLGDTGDDRLSFSETLTRKVLKRHHRKLYRLGHVSREDAVRSADREALLQSQARLGQQLSDTDAEISKTQSDLETLEIQYRELSPDSDLRAIDATIDRLEVERDKHPVHKPQFELSEAELQRRYAEWSDLQTRLLVFSDRAVPLYPSRKRQHRESMLTRAQYRQSSWGMRLSDLKTQYDTVSRRHTLQPSDIPDSPCAKERCPLYSHFMGEYQHSETQRQALAISIAKGERKITRLNGYVAGLLTYFEQAKPYNDAIAWLARYAQDNPVLHQLLRGMDILQVLATQPQQIARLLQENYRHIEQWLKRKAIQADLETAYALKSRHISSESHDTIKLVSSIDDKKAALVRLRRRYIGLGEQAATLKQALQDIDAFETIKRDVLALQAHHHQMAKAFAERHEQERLLYLQRTIGEIRSQHFLRLSKIEGILRAQSGLKERYQEEVIAQIAIIEKEFNDQSRIEAALIAIPKAHQVAFINRIFDQANRLIGSIWTIPLQIELLSLDDPLTYNFYVSGDNQSIREMNECSEGQLEVLSLAMNLAIRILLKHLDLPLCLDEVGRAMDERHKQNLVLLLKRLIDDRIISELFFVSHHAAMHDGFSQSETLVIREDNIMLPPSYNNHVVITH